MAELSVPTYFVSICLYILRKTVQMYPLWRLILSTDKVICGENDPGYSIFLQLWYSDKLHTTAKLGKTCYIPLLFPRIL